MESIWNEENMQDASNKWQFIVVTPSLGLIRTNITDIQAIWSVYPEVVVHTGARILGFYDDVVKAFVDGGISEDEAIESMEAVIKSDNFDSTGEEYYESELGNYNLWKAQTIENNAAENTSSLQDLLILLNPHLLQKKPIAAAKTRAPVKGRTTTTKKTVSPGKVGRGVTPLQEKINALEDGKLLNVSKITEKGTLTSIQARPGTTRLFIPSDERLPLITNNLEHFLIAVDLLEGGRDEYAEAVAEADDHFNGKVVKAKSPVRSTKAREQVDSNDEDVIFPEKVTPFQKGGKGPVKGPVNKPTSTRQAIPIPLNTSIPVPESTTSTIPVPESTTTTTTTNIPTPNRRKDI